MLKRYYLGGFFWVPIPLKQYQNRSGFAVANIVPQFGGKNHILGRKN